MNRLLLTGFILITSYFPGISQPETDPVARYYLRQRIDSMQQEMRNTRQDSLLVKKLSFLSNLYARYRYDSALMYAYRAVYLAEKLKNPFALGLGYRSMSVVFYLQKMYDSAIFYSRKGLDISVSNELYSHEHLFRVDMNNIYFLQGNYSGAMVVSTEGLVTSEKIRDSGRIAHYNNVLGCIMLKLENYEQSGRYFSAELRMAQLTGDKRVEAHALLNLADLSIAEKKMDKAIGFIKRALHVYQTHLPLDTARQVYTYNKLAEAYKQMHRDTTALGYSLKAVGLTNPPIGNDYDIAAYYINTGDIYNRMHKPDSALYYLRRGLSIAKIIKHREILRDGYEQLSFSFAMRKEYDSAYIYQRSFSGLKDSLLSETSQRDILQRDADLQIERQRSIQKAELSRQQLWRNIIIAVSIFLIVLVVMLYNRRRIKQKMIYQRVLNQQQNEMFNLTSSVQDKERKRIAEDIHDGLGSVLSAAKLKLSSLEDDNRIFTDDQREKYQATLSLLDEAAIELRNISHNIMPATLSKLGLVAAIKNVIDNISSHSGPELLFETHGFDERLEESEEISIYRIVLELLNNIVKHAQAGKAVVQLIKYPGYINITVEDNGVGFDYMKTRDQSKGIGLGNIKSRVNYLNGTLDVDSMPGRGTVTIIDIPYNSRFVKYQDVGIKKG